MRVSPTAENFCAKDANTCRANSRRAKRPGLKPSIGPSSRWSGSMPPPPYTFRPASVYLRSDAERSRGALWARDV